MDDLLIPIGDLNLFRNYCGGTYILSNGGRLVNALTQAILYRKLDNNDGVIQTIRHQRIASGGIQACNSRDTMLQSN